MRAITGRAVTLAEMESLVRVCSPALSCPELSAAVCNAVVGMCSSWSCASAENHRVTCGAAGVIPLIVAAMSAHSTDSGASSGCDALCWLIEGNTANADAVVVSESAGGLSEILSVMASHTENAQVLGFACLALELLARNVSSSAKLVMRQSAVVELLNAAKVDHPSSGIYQKLVMRNADAALTVLTA